MPNAASAVKPFIHRHCGAIPEGSSSNPVLFGHVIGSFTGAPEMDRRGKAEARSWGTGFLDEIRGDAASNCKRRFAAHRARRLRKGRPRANSAVGGYPYFLRNASQPARSWSRKWPRSAKTSTTGLKRHPLKTPSLRATGHGRTFRVTQFSSLSEACTSHGRKDLTLPERPSSIAFGHRWPGNIRGTREYP